MLSYLPFFFLLQKIIENLKPDLPDPDRFLSAGFQIFFQSVNLTAIIRDIFGMLLSEFLILFPGYLSYTVTYILRHITIYNARKKPS